MLVCYCVAIPVSQVTPRTWRMLIAEQDLLDEWHDETDFRSRRFVYVL